jgi:hypothetical protein
MSLYFIDATIDNEHHRYCIMAQDPIEALIRVRDRWSGRIIIADSIEIKEVPSWESPR